LLQRCDEVEVPAEHDLDPPAAPAAAGVADQRSDAFAIAADDGARIADLREPAGEDLMRICGPRLLEEPGRRPHPRDDASAAIALRPFEQMQPRFGLKRAEGAEAAHLKDHRALPPARRMLLELHAAALGPAALHGEDLAGPGGGLTGILGLGFECRLDAQQHIDR